MKEQVFISASPNKVMMENKYSEVEILLVEDNMHDAALIIRALRKEDLADHLMHVKDDGEYAWPELKDTLRIILLDVKMPVANGMKVLKQIRSHDNTNQIPVAVITSPEEEEEIIKNHLLDANSFVVRKNEFKSFAKAMKAANELAMNWDLAVY
jgi:DNA-binding response OmpR family regulator